MKRYVRGMVTGTLVGAVVAGLWLLGRPRRRIYPVAMRQARRFAPLAYHVARAQGHRLLRVAKRRMR
ncbi:MAG: hypothetical protein OWU84_02280 [Firmicutes bacterium]|nr:hypothetical protein [Bacillota bacterium]